MAVPFFQKWLSQSTKEPLQRDHLPPKTNFKGVKVDNTPPRHKKASTLQYIIVEIESKRPIDGSMNVAT